jgi:hypothetical protein
MVNCSTHGSSSSVLLVVLHLWYLRNLRMRVEIWCRRRESNPHRLVSKTSASARLGYAGALNLVNPAGLEPATSSSASLCSDSI